MKIAICDDLSGERKIIREFLTRYEQEHNFEYMPYEYDSAESLIAGLSKEPADLIFLDIYMVGMTGMDAAKKLLAVGYGGHIIFITTSRDHAVDSYSIDADGYIVKPFSYEEFARRFDKVAKKWLNSFKSIAVKSDRLEFQIFLKDIEYIESGDHCSYIYAKGEPVRTTKLISQFDEELVGEPCFLRCHQSCIVNLNRVKKSDEEFIYLKSGKKLLMAIRHRQGIRKIIADYYWMQTREMRGGHE